MITTVTELPPKENTLSYSYVKLVKLVLAQLGCWPGHALGDKTPLERSIRTFVLVQMVTAITGQSIFIYKYFNTLDFLMKGYSSLFLLWHLFSPLVRILLPWFPTYGLIVKTFLMSFHLAHFKHLGKHYEQVFKKIEKISTFFTIWLITITFTAASLFYIVPIYQDYTRGLYTNYNPGNLTVDCLLCVTIPGIIDTKEFKIWTRIYSMYPHCVSCLATSGFDLLLYQMVFQILGHIQILNKEFQCIDLLQNDTVSDEDNSFIHNGMKVPVVKMFNAEQNEIINKKLVDIVKYHRMILNFVKDISKTFGPMLGCTCMLQLSAGCLLLLLCTKGESAQFFPLTVYIFGQLISISVIFEIIYTESEKLEKSVYATPWELMDIRNRRIVYVMLQRIQTPISITAMNIAPIGVTTMLKILKATMSYFTMLKTFEQQ